MGGNGLGRPFGHPIYHEIYAAAAELDLPIVVHAGGDVSTDAMARPNAGGPVATYAEYHMLQAHSLMTHCVSMIGQGVFTKYPGLRMLLVGGGVTWIPSLIWRFDTEYRGMGPRDATWLTELPGQYFRRHVRVAAYPFDGAPEPANTERMLRAMPELAEVLCYASGFPSWDTVWPADLTTVLPAGWRERVMYENANSFFRWSPTMPSPRTSATAADREADPR
jgi:predicted TIM-barrel fold metal-dependent hydrolase